MRRAIATVSMSGTLRQKFEAVAAARFDAVELFEPDFINFNGSARQLRALADDLGIAVDLYQPLRDFEGMPEATFKRNLERAERKFDLMQEVGAPLMLVCSNVSPQSLGEPERAAAQLYELAERAARRNLRIGFEALAWGRWVKLYRQAWSIVERAAHPHLGIILDSMHTLSLLDDPSGIALIPGDKIFFVQMADAPLLAMDVLQWARHHRNFPGQGQFDCENFYEQCLRAGYTGTLSLEIFNDVFRSTPNRRTTVDAMRSLLYLEGRVRERLERARDSGPQQGVQGGHAIGNGKGNGNASLAAGRALARVDLFHPPEAVRFDRYAFIEFGLDEAGAEALGSLLEKFGFARVGQHRSKAVSLYRQGGIDFVINSQPGSPARERFEEQGPTVGAIGLVADDAQRAASRAAALLSARHHSPRGPRELELPAIVAPGGMVLHFVPRDRSLDPDFGDELQGPRGAGVDGTLRAGAVISPAACGLIAIDHVALGLANDQFDTWVLFCRAVLGLERGDSLELADPFGLIRSCGVANAERSLRMVLNVSMSQRTRTARQVSASKSSGSGVHHIAMRSEDIFGTVGKLRANGVRFVPISANYYDDLVARLDLEEGLISRMKSLDILFDASPNGGRYFHAYTEAFADRFFFEVVQRESYDGYGAINAPARMASQEQQGEGQVSP